MPIAETLRHPAIGIRAKVGLLVGGLVVLSASLAGYLSYRQSSSALVETAMEEVHAMTGAAAARLAADLDSLRTDAEFLAAAPASKQLARLASRGEAASADGERQDAMAGFTGLASLVFRTNDPYRRVSLFNARPAGRLIVAVDRSGAAGVFHTQRGAAEAPSATAPDPLLVAVASEPGAGVRLSEARRAAEPGVEVGFQAAAPVYDEAGRLAAILVIEEDLAPVIAEIASTVPRQRALVVVNDAGRSLVPREVEGAAAGRAAELGPTLAQALERGEMKAGTLIRRDAGGGKIAASAQQVSLGAPAMTGFFGVAVVADYQDVVASARLVRDQTLVITLVLVAIALLLGWRMAAGIAGPLDQITSTVEAYGQGSRELELPLEAGGEAGLVARAFDHMAQQVDERTQLLQAEIDARRLTEEALRGSEQRFRAFYNDSPAMFLGTDAEGRIVSVNRFGATFLGYRIEDLVGRCALDLVPEADHDEVREFVRTAHRGVGQLHEREGRMLRIDGDSAWVRTVVRVAETEDGPQLLWVGEDTTRAHELSEDLSFREHHDPLTGLPNRREVERRLQILIEHSAEKGSEHALCLFDLDQFKIVNDTCGHAVGDELLRQVSQVLEAHIDAPDLLARLGGDEFAVLLKECPLHHAVSRVEGLRAALKTMRFEWEGERFEITTSVGLVQIRGDEHSVSTALSLADTLCFAAKDAGRDRLQAYQEGDSSLEQIQEQMKAVSMINKAFEEDRFRLYRQPIVPVTGGEKGDHFEILIRMIGEEGQVLPPGVFLQSAERYNLAGRIDRWVVASTLNWLKRNPEELDQLCLCSINLSGQSLGDGELLEFIESQFDDGIIAPEKICFEITETVAVANMKAAVEFIQRLKKRGCLFALDDFGSGLSSFAYLRNLPVDLLKIDGMFVRDIATDATAYAMVKSIHEVGQVMGKRTIAEFVENDRILAKLGLIGVDYAQGYGISAPKPIEEPLFEAGSPRGGQDLSGDRDAA